MPLDPKVTPEAYWDKCWSEIPRSLYFLSETERKKEVLRLQLLFPPGVCSEKTVTRVCTAERQKHTVGHDRVIYCTPKEKKEIREEECIQMCSPNTLQCENEKKNARSQLSLRRCFLILCTLNCACPCCAGHPSTNNMCFFSPAETILL